MYESMHIEIMILMLMVEDGSCDCGDATGVHGCTDLICQIHLVMVGMEII